MGTCAPGTRGSGDCLEHTEIGLPQQSIPLALLFFNVGVELGQLLFVAAVVSAGWVLRKLISEKILQGSEVAASYLIGSLSAYWVIERTYSFWS